MKKIKELTDTSNLFDGCDYMFGAKTRICMLLENVDSPKDLNETIEVTIREIHKNSKEVKLGKKKKIRVTHYEELYGKEGPITMMLANGEYQYVVPRQYNSDDYLPKIAFCYGEENGHRFNLNKELNLELDEICIYNNSIYLNKFILENYNSHDNWSNYSNFRTNTHQIWVF